MNDRRSRSKVRNKTIAWAAAGIVHLLIIGAVFINFTSEPDAIEVFDADEIADTVKAKVVDESEIKNRQDELKQKDLDKKRKEELERQRLRDLQKAAEREKQSIADLQEKVKSEQQAADLAERLRKEVKLKAEQEELERLKKEAERKKREEAEQRRRERIAAEKKKADERDRIKREQQEIEAQRRLNELIEEEARMLQQQAQIRQDQAVQQQAARRTATIRSKYGALIRDAINAKRSIAPDFERWRVAKVQIKLSPQGDVQATRVVQSSGSERYDRDAETAIRQASPLPIPSQAEDATAHEEFRNPTLTIRMPGAN
jgi:colicin import membrane protein